MVGLFRLANPVVSLETNKAGLGPVWGLFELGLARANIIWVPEGHHMEPNDQDFSQHITDPVPVLTLDCGRRNAPAS